jgi:hypothetical protein
MKYNKLLVVSVLSLLALTSCGGASGSSSSIPGVSSTPSSEQQDPIGLNQRTLELLQNKIKTTTFTFDMETTIGSDTTKQERVYSKKLYLDYSVDEDGKKTLENCFYPYEGSLKHDINSNPIYQGQACSDFLGINNAATQSFEYSGFDKDSVIQPVLFANHYSSPFSFLEDMSLADFKEAFSVTSYSSGTSTFSFSPVFETSAEATELADKILQFSTDYYIYILPIYANFSFTIGAGDKITSAHLITSLTSNDKTTYYDSSIEVSETEGEASKPALEGQMPDISSSGKANYALTEAFQSLKTPYENKNLTQNVTYSSGKTVRTYSNILDSTHDIYMSTNKILAHDKIQNQSDDSKYLAASLGCYAALATPIDDGVDKWYGAYAYCLDEKPLVSKCENMSSNFMKDTRFDFNPSGFSADFFVKDGNVYTWTIDDSASYVNSVFETYINYSLFPPVDSNFRYSITRSYSYSGTAVSIYTNTVNYSTVNYSSIVVTLGDDGSLSNIVVNANGPDGYGNTADFSAKISYKDLSSTDISKNADTEVVNFYNTIESFKD